MSSATTSNTPPDGGDSEHAALSRNAVELNRSIFEIMPGGIVHVSAAGAILRANPEAQRLLGYSYDALTRRYTTDWSPETIFEDGSPCPVAAYPVSRALTTGKPDGPLTLGVKRPDGRLFWAVFRATPVFESDGETVGGAVVTFLDVSTEREHITRLNQREKDLSSLIRNIPHYVVNYTPEGTIVFVNRVDESLTGLQFLQEFAVTIIQEDVQQLEIDHGAIILAWWLEGLPSIRRSAIIRRKEFSWHNPYLLSNIR